MLEGAGTMGEMLAVQRPWSSRRKGVLFNSGSGTCEKGNPIGNECHSHRAQSNESSGDNTESG